jgi:hypothetical protein
MADVKLTSDKGSMQDRIHARLRNSGDGEGARPDFTVRQGNSPTRTFHNVHHGSSQGGAKRQNRDSDGSK